MFSLFGRGTSVTSKVIAIIDVGSGSVGGALGRLNRDGLPELFFTVREELPVRLTRSAREMALASAQAAGRVFEQVKKAAALYTEGTKVAPMKIEHIAVFLAAPWSTTQLHMVKMEKEKPFTMTLDTLRKMLTEEARDAASRLKADTRIIERIATGLYLNGYRSERTSSAPIMRAEVTLASTLAPEAFIDLLDEKMGDLVRGVERTYHSFALPAAHTFSLWRPYVQDAVLIDAGAEVTELILIHGGTPAGVATAPIGHNHLLRTLKSRAGMEKSEAITTLRLAEDERTRLSQVMRDAIVEGSREWASAITKAFAGIQVAGATPTEAYLFADSHTRSWFNAALSRTPLAMQASGVVLAPTAITEEDFTDLIVLRGTRAEPYLAAELIFADARLDDGKSLSLASPRDLILSRPRGIIHSI